MVTESTIDVRGIELWVRDHGGDGEPLLMVMGLGGQAVDWPPELIDRLTADGFRVIVFDNRDSGLSTHLDWTPPSRWRVALALLTGRTLDVDYTLPDLADDAVGVLDAVGLESAHVLGISMGGMIAQLAAIQHPERVRSLCSIMSNTGDRRHGGIHPRVLWRLARADVPTRAEAPEVLTEQYSWWSGPAWRREVHLERARAAVARDFDPEATARQSASILASGDRTEALGGLDVATLVIHGLADTLVLPSGGEATCRAIPGARLLVFPDMGHDLPFTRLDEIVAAVRSNADRGNAASGASDVSVDAGAVAVDSIPLG